MPDWTVIPIGILAFALASLAAQSWRELLILIALSLVAYVPLKWLTSGNEFGAQALEISTRPERWGLSLTLTGAVLTAIALAAAAMILARHAWLVRQERREAEVKRTAADGPPQAS